MDFLYEAGNPISFAVITVILGGGAGWLTGRAVAYNWRPLWQVVASAVLLAAAVRFLHFALGEGQLLSTYYYLVDLLVVLAAGLLGYRRTQARLMVRQYPWLYEAAGPFSWRDKGGAPETPG